MTGRQWVTVAVVVGRQMGPALRGDDFHAGRETKVVGSEDFQAGGRGVLLEGGDGLGVGAKKLFDGVGGLVKSV